MSPTSPTSWYACACACASAGAEASAGVSTGASPSRSRGGRRTRSSGLYASAGRVLALCRARVGRHLGSAQKKLKQNMSVSVQERGREVREQKTESTTHLVRTPLMAPPPGRTDEAIGTRAAIEPAAGRVRVHPEHELDILTGALDVDAPIADAVGHLDAAPLFYLVPLEPPGVERSEDDVRVVRIELALVPARGGLLGRPPSRRGGGGGESSGSSGYMNAKGSRKLIVWSSRSPSCCSAHPSSCRCRRSYSPAADERTRIALAYAAPHASGIRVPEAGREECVGDDDGERGAPVGRERARRDGEWQARIDERA